MCASKKGISTRQLQRMLGVGMKTAWFMGHRIREAMAPAPGSVEPLGGAGVTIEADETVLNRSPKTKNRPTQKQDKQEILALVERGGHIRSVFLDHMDEKHLHRYLAEFDFRQNYRVKLGFNDVERAEVALDGVVGKRLMYRDSL
jgi:hypothetical protein